MQNTQNDMQSNVPHGDQNDIRRPEQFSHSPIRTQDVGREQQLLQLPAGTPEVQTASPQTELQKNEITLRAAAETIQRHRVAIFIVFAISAQQPSLEDKICFYNTGVLQGLVTVRRVREALLDIAKRYGERKRTQQSLILLNSFAPPDSSIFQGVLEGIQTELEQLAYQLRQVATLFGCWKKLNGQSGRQAEPK